MDQRSGASGSHFWLNWSNNISRSNRFSLAAGSSSPQHQHNGNGNDQLKNKNSPRLDGTPRRLAVNGRRSRETSATRNNQDDVGVSCNNVMHNTPTRCHYGTPRKNRNSPRPDGTPRREQHPSGGNVHHHTGSSNMTRSGPPAIVYSTPHNSVFSTFYPSPMLSRSSPGLDLYQRCGNSSGIIGNSSGGKGTPVHQHQMNSANIYADPNPNNNYEGSSLVEIIFLFFLLR